jgi:hypothetical protein
METVRRSKEKALRRLTTKTVATTSLFLDPYKSTIVAGRYANKLRHFNLASA